MHQSQYPQDNDDFVIPEEDNDDSLLQSTETNDIDM